ncbi:MAG TPA: hypothetical protein VFH15_10675 [Pyrinomonadaceae bacterium]|nr:hypothetical protein [Pyrinomonadaceae bacterium]
MTELLKEEQRRLYVVTAPRFTGEVFDVTRHSLDQSFQGWLHAVHPTEELNMSAQAIAINNDLRRPSELKQKPALQLCHPVKGQQAVNAVTLRSGKLTTQDYVQVMMATIREGRHHARWPKDVVAHFLAAEVIVSSEQ